MTIPTAEVSGLPVLLGGLCRMPGSHSCVHSSSSWVHRRELQSCFPVVSARVGLALSVNVLCAAPGCGIDGLKYNTRAAHETQACPNRMMFCTNGCGTAFPAHEQAEHEATGEWSVCPSRTVRCRYGGCAHDSQCWCRAG